MKKLFLLILLLFIPLCFVGCKITDYCVPNGFSVIEEMDYAIKIVDNETGIVYLYTITARNSGIVALLKSNGEPQRYNFETGEIY